MRLRTLGLLEVGRRALGRRLHGLEISGRAGLLLGAWTNGLSFQPNLIARGSHAQAVISGIAAATAFGWGSASHSFLRSLANRIPGAATSPATRAVTGLAVDSAVALGCRAVTRALAPSPSDPPLRALARLAASATAGSAVAGLGADLLEIRRGRRGNRTTTIGATIGAWAAGYALARTGVVGSAARPPGGRPLTGALRAASPAPEHIGPPVEEPVPEVDVPAAAAAGIGVTLALIGLSWVESRLSTLAAGAAARALGGEPDDHRTLGRGAVWAVVASAGWFAFTRVNAALTVAGDEVEPAHAAPPAHAEVTGGPGSRIPWSVQSRESRRWLSMTLRKSAIERVMGEPAEQPIRLYSPLRAARTGEERAGLLLEEIDRTGALQRPVVVVYSPTGSGYVNYVVTETVEFLTRGRCASVALQYSVLPSALSLTKVGLGAEQTRTVMNGLVERLLEIPREDRPRLLLFGESLGARVSQEMFAGQGVGAVDGVALDRGLWVGTPAGTRWRDELWGGRPVSRAPSVGPGGAYLPRSIGDWLELDDDALTRVHYLLLQNGNDPVPKFAPPLLWRQPDWLGPDHERPPGAPRGTRWLPITTFFTTFVDFQNALRPTPGRFAEGGHDYRRALPLAVRTVFDLDATPEQMARVEAALRRRELVWAARRRWVAAQVRPEEERRAAVAALVADVAAWTGGPIDEDGVRDLAASEA